MKKQKFNEAYTNANNLEVGSKFDYLGETYIVDHFDTRIIASPAGTNKVLKLKPHEFEGYIYYGFLKITK